MSEPDQFDVCKSRHRGNAQSIKANPSASIKTRDRDAVYGLIASDGITSKEIAEAMGKVDLSKPYLTTQEAATVLQKSPETLRNNNRKGIGPFPIDQPGRPLYSTTSVLGLPEKIPAQVQVS
jgi:hypothetical protein